MVVTLLLSPPLSHGVLPYLLRILARLPRVAR